MIEIHAFPTSNPDVCEFKTTETLLEAATYYCKSEEDALGSVLCELIFNLPGVVEVYVKQNSVTVKKSGDQSWKEFGPKVGEAIRSAYSDERPFFSQGLLNKIYQDKRPKVGNDEILKTDLGKKVQDVLQEFINPALSAHGGFAQLVDIQNRIAILKFGGGCQGCSQITVTVKQGVENLLKEHVPEIEGVRDETDHDAGTNPFFK
ncbi:MAG: NifU family protein [Bacteriovoracaceae bacterium]